MMSENHVRRRHMWQLMPSMAFKLGLYQGAVRVGDVRRHGNFGVGQFAALDGELTVLEGQFIRARADGSVREADDEDELCFAQLCFFEAEDTWNVSQSTDQAGFEQLFHAKIASVNAYWAFHIQGVFSAVVATAPPPLSQPFPPFSEATMLRHSFQGADVTGSMIGLFSPIFTGQIGIPGFHYHWISDDRKLSGHVTAFTISNASVQTMRVEGQVLELPLTAEFLSAKIAQPDS